MSRLRQFITAAALAALGLALTGCGGTTEQPDELVVLCGTSFRPATEALQKQYEEATGNKLVLSFGGSEDLLPQVKAKSTGDVFVTHDPYLEYTEKAGALHRAIQVGQMGPALVVQKGNPKQIRSIEDLAKPGLKVMLTNPEYSTCGEMVYALLEKKGIKDEVLANVEDRLFRSHADVANKMKLGLADAAIIWNATAYTFRDDLELVPVPYEYDTDIRVHVIGLSYSEKKDLLDEFLKFVDEHGKKLYAEHGYVKEFDEDDSATKTERGEEGEKEEGSPE